MTKKLDSHRRRSDADRRWRQAEAVVRKLKLLQILTGRGFFDKKSLAVELAERCGQASRFSIKTIERDLRVLELAGVILEEHGTNPKQYRVRPDSQFPILNLTAEEMLGQASATVITSTPGLNVGRGAQATSRKLAASREEVEDWMTDVRGIMEVFSLRLADHSQHQSIIDHLQVALVEGRQVTGDYDSPYKSQPVKLTLHPYRLCLAGQAWYLVARSVLDESPKTYRVQRFRSLRRTAARAEVPQSFSLKEYFGNAWSVWRGAESFDIELEFAKDAAPLVCETTWHHTQRIVKRYADGRLSLGFTIDGLDEILWWVLGWGSRVRVVQPPKLRDMVLEQLKQATRINGRSR